MSLFQQTRKILIGLVLVMVLTITTACGGATKVSATSAPPALNGSTSYQQLERGNSPIGQDFGNWVVQTAKGLVKDAYVRDNNKLGVVITSQVRPNEVKTLSKSLIEGFHRKFPNQDLTVLVYAPDKHLILTTRYDEQSKQIQYQGA